MSEQICVMLLKNLYRVTRYYYVLFGDCVRVNEPMYDSFEKILEVAFDKIISLGKF